MSTRYPLCFALVACFSLGLVSHAQKEPSTTYDGPKEKLHVYLLIGQSNMAGRAPFSEEEAAAVPRCYLLNAQDGLEPACNPLNRYSTIRKGLGMQKMNPGYTFAKAMTESDASVSLCLVVNAKGGSNINEWAKGMKFYGEALRRTKAALKWGILRGILWHQGESNSKDADYLDKLQTLISDLRTDLGEPEVPFVAGQINDVPLINEQLAKLPEIVPFTGCASADGLKAMDRWHFDARSMKLLGQRYAEQMVKIQASQGAAESPREE